MQAMEEQSQILDDAKDEELKRQADYLTTAQVEATIRERSQRSAQLDEVSLSFTAHEINLHFKFCTQVPGSLS